MAREFKAMSDWSAELFAPASTLAAVHSFIAVALARGLQIAVLDVKDAYQMWSNRTPWSSKSSGRSWGRPGPA